MDRAADSGIQLIREFSEHYMETLFYFCLKKTGDSDAAEELTHDTAYQIISALSRGSRPTNFPAWVWQIARNRYAVWAKEKHTRAERICASDIDDCTLVQEDGDILDDMIRAEQLTLLRRELAFIKSEFRGIIVAHYIEG